MNGPLLSIIILTLFLSLLQLEAISLPKYNTLNKNKSSLYIIGKSKELPLESIVDDLPLTPIRVIQRLPTAALASGTAAFIAFISTLCMITPVGLLMNIKQITTPKIWLNSAFGMGKNWSKVSMIFSGGEVFIEKIRMKTDRQNSYIGSGLGSAFLATAEGPVAMMNGFLVGYAFMYMFDRMSSSSSESADQLNIDRKAKNIGSPTASLLQSNKITNNSNKMKAMNKGKLISKPPRLR